MQPEVPALVWDARHAAQRVRDFVNGRTKVEYDTDIIVWEVATTRVEPLIETLDLLLSVSDGPEVPHR